jgi:hypothetical protein
MGPLRKLLVACSLSTALLACGSPTPTDAGSDARPLVCEVPLTIQLVASTEPPSPGVPAAGIAWTSGQCMLVTDESSADLVLYIADLAPLDSGLVATVGNGYGLVSSSAGTPSATYVADLPRDTDITVEVESEDVAFVIVFRVVSNTMTLLDMHVR